MLYCRFRMVVSIAFIRCCVNCSLDTLQNLLRALIQAREFRGLDVGLDKLDWIVYTGVRKFSTGFDNKIVRFFEERVSKSRFLRRLGDLFSHCSSS
jgi:hypothetical protein